MQDRDAVHWLQLTYKVPSEPSQKRVWVWRHLQNLGAYALQNSVYLLPASEEVETRFRQLAHEIQEMGGEASLFRVQAMDIEDERRILRILLEARQHEYSTVTTVCRHFLAKTFALAQSQEWTTQDHAEFSEVLEKVHVLFRTAKRHDLLGSLTASPRASAAEALVTCEQVFRVLQEKDFTRARRLLDAHRDFFQSAIETPETLQIPASVLSGSNDTPQLKGYDNNTFH